MLKFAVRTLAWVALLAILAMTLSPIDDRPHLATDPSVERAAAFFLLGLLFCIGYRQRWPIALGIVLVAAGGFEAAQLLTPDRHAGVADTLVKIAGGVVGFGAGLLLRI
jgi:VanZ family protein